jgi:hypothetical protein
MQCGLISGIQICSEAVLGNKSERIVMSQRHPFSTVSCFRRFVSRDKISHYFNRFICQRLYYDAENA